MNGYRIYNHFHNLPSAYGKCELVPECRAINAIPTPGFACGTDTRLETGSEVVIPNVPGNAFGFDSRGIKLLRRSRYPSLETDLDSHSYCADQSGNYTCEPINHFSDGCASPIQSVNGLTRTGYKLQGIHSGTSYSGQIRRTF